MRAQIATTGIVFGLVTLSHLARSVELWHRFNSDPWYVVGMCLLTLLSGGLSIWAWRLFRLPRQRLGIFLKHGIGDWKSSTDCIPPNVLRYYVGTTSAFAAEINDAQFKFNRCIKPHSEYSTKFRSGHHSYSGGLIRMRRQTYRRVFLQHLKQILQDLEYVRTIQPEDLSLLELKRAVRNKIDRIQCSEADD